MKKENFIKKKPHLNIGTIGHVDHGKTTLTVAITSLLHLENHSKKYSYKDIDASPEEQLRGITINTSHIEYETLNRHYAHIDCPGHADYIKNMITGAAQLDAAILVISAVEGPMPQTKEHILLSKQIGISNLIVFLNKIDQIDDQELIELVELETQELVEFYGYTNVKIIKGSALKALESITNTTNLKKGNNIWTESLYDLLDSIDLLPAPKRNTELDFLMPIEGIFSITGRGTVVTGKVERGKVKLGDTLDVIGIKPTIKNTAVIGIEMFNKIMQIAEAGDNIGLLLRGIEKTNVIRGMLVTKPNTIKLNYKFEAEVYILTSEEGGRHKPFFVGYKPQFFIRTTNITGVISNIKNLNSDMVLPGDKITLEITLIHYIALEKNLRFAIREGGKTIGAGIITNLLK